MGKEIRIYNDERNDSNETGSTLMVANLLNDMRQLSTSELKEYFEKMFEIMNSTAKEAVTEIMWTKLSTEEQQTFEMPYFGHRWSENAINYALNNAFVLPDSAGLSREHPIRTGRSANFRGLIHLI